MVATSNISLENFHAANPWGRWMFNVRVLKPWRFGDDFLRIQKILGE